MPRLRRPAAIRHLPRLLIPEVAMTDEEFLACFNGGLDIKGQRVTAQIGNLDAHEAVASGLATTVARVFLIQVNHGKRLPITFVPGEGFNERMARVDAAVDRWLIVHG